MKNSVMFSVIVPVYNAEKYLSESIQSVLSQTYDIFELILINDGSIDASEEICNRYSSDSRVKVIHKENSGQLAARNLGVQLASGDYCVFLDADDTLENHTLKTLNSKIQQYQSDCIIYNFQRDNIREDDKTNSDIAPVSDSIVNDKRELYRKVFMNRSYNSMCRKAAKVELFTTRDYSTFHSLRHGEDLLQSLDIYRNSEQIVFIDDTLYNYRTNLESVTHSFTYDNYNLDSFIVREMVFKLIEEEGVFSEKDFWDLRNYSLFLLLKQVRLIASFSTNISNKIDLYKRIKSSSYYRFLNSDDNYNLERRLDAFLYGLFQKNCYRKLVIVEQMFRFLRTIINNLRIRSYAGR